MKQDDLFYAIGQLDEDILAESEAAMTVRPKRVLWKAVVVAAAMAMMVMSVTAVANWFVGLNNANPEVTSVEFEVEFYRIDENGVGTGEILSSEKAYRRDITMEIDVNPDVPNVLETAYMLQVPEHWGMENKGGGFTDGQVDQFFVVWDPNGDSDGVITSYSGPEGDWVEDLVIFRQRSAHSYSLWDDHRVGFLIGIPDRVEVTSEIVVLGGVSVLKVHIPAFDMTLEESKLITFREHFMQGGEFRLYWSDGDSILSLNYPAWMTDEEIGELLSTIFVVEDIEEYLNLERPPERTAEE